MDKLDRLAFDIKVLTTKALTEADPTDTLEKISELAEMLATNTNAARRERGGVGGEKRGKTP